MNTACSRPTSGARITLRPFPRRLAYRLRQGIGALVPALPVDRDDILASTLSPEQERTFRLLSRVDQAHLLRTYRAVLMAEPDASWDLRVAALLHDIGKSSSDGRVRLAHRVLRVGLSRYLPSIWNRLAALPAHGWRTGFALSEHHPALGAKIAERLGCSERTCWLIGEHGRKRIPMNCAELRALMIADHQAR